MQLAIQLEYRRMALSFRRLVISKDMGGRLDICCKYVQLDLNASDDGVELP
jgi:hypothetical protein